MIKKDSWKTFSSFSLTLLSFLVKSESYSVKVVDNNIIIHTVIVLEGFASARVFYLLNSQALCMIQDTDDVEQAGHQETVIIGVVGIEVHDGALSCCSFHEPSHTRKQDAIDGKLKETLSVSRFGSIKPK